jgi:hypothetical protein
MAWTRIFTTLNICGALLTVPAAAAGLYTSYQTTFSTDATCRALRRSILSALEKEVDARIKQALIRKDVAEFEHSCGLGHQGSKALANAISSNDLAAKRGYTAADSHAVQVVRPSLPFLRRWLDKQGAPPIPSPRDPGKPIGT